MTLQTMSTYLGVLFFLFSQNCRLSFPTSKYVIFILSYVLSSYSRAGIKNSMGITSIKAPVKIAQKLKMLDRWNTYVTFRSFSLYIYFDQFRSKQDLEPGLPRKNSCMLHNQQKMGIHVHILDFSWRGLL